MARIPAVKAAVKLGVEVGRFNQTMVKYLDATGLDLQKGVEAAAFKLEAMAKRRAPVDTGRFRASIHTVLYGASPQFSYSVAGEHAGGRVTVRQTRRTTRSLQTVFNGTLSTAPRSPFEAVVGTNVEYALYLEAGHSAQAPAGVFRISVEELRGAFKTEIASILRKRKRFTDRG